MLDVDFVLVPSDTVEVSMSFPSLYQVTVGFGFPLGGRHFSTAVSPKATLVSTGIIRKSSRKTENEKKSFDYNFFVDTLTNYAVTKITNMIIKCIVYKSQF